MKAIRRRLTFANVTALLALFVSLSGGVYAASKISGSKIKKESIAGKKLKDDGVTGQQVDEATLGKVPSAQSADTAGSAQSAATAATAQTAASAQTLAGTPPGGFVSSADVEAFRFDRTVAEGAPDAEATVLELGPLTLTAECSRQDDIFRIFATSSAPSAGIDSGYVVDADVQTTTDGGGLGATPLRVTGAGGANLSRRVVGNIVYNDPTMVISIPFAIFYNAPNNPAETRCFFTGTATKVGV